MNGREAYAVPAPRPHSHHSQLTQSTSLVSCGEAVSSRYLRQSKATGDSAPHTLPCLAVAFYVVAVPLALWLAFSRGMGAEGLYLGMVAGPVIQTFSYVVLLLRLDWEREAR